MKTTTAILIISIAIVPTLFTGCNDDDEPVSKPATVTTKTDINASEHMAYLNLTTGEEVPASEASTGKWDIAFDGANENIYITANTQSGSGQVLSTGFDDLTEAPADGYLDGDEAFLDFTKWANYTGETTSPFHAVLAKAGTVIVVKTPDGKYAKVQIIGFYQGNPDTSTPQFADFSTRPAYGYYSIRYAIQTNGTRQFN